MKNLLLLIVMSIKLLIRGALLLCLTLGPLMANTSKAQVKSIDEVFIKLDRKSYSLTRFFKETEKQTDFKFFYTDKALHVGQKIDLTKNWGNVEEFLIEIAKQTDLRFRQVNNAISVIIAPKENGQDLIQVELDPQNVDVQGTVTDADEEPIPGVTVSVQGSSTGTATDLDGKYSLSVPEGSTLMFSFIGFETQRIEVGEQRIINVTLNEDISSLDEVVVVGYGEQKKANLTGSVASLDSEFLADRPITNSSQALQGLPGVYVNQSKGRPGADGANISIRGIGTIGNSNPLVIVDGIEFSLRDINPNDIESVTVLKDAASSAIYGSRAANGVILITTKKGKEGRLQAEYGNYFGFQRATQLPQNVVWNSMEYMEGKNRALANLGIAPEYPDALLEEYRNGTDPYIYPNTNWFNVMFRDAFIQEHNVRVTGGNEKTTFSASLGYLDQDGVLIQSDAQRYSVNLNLVSNVTDKLTLGVNMIGTFWKDRESHYSADEGNGEGGLMGLIYRGLPFQSPTLEDGRYADQWIRAAGHNAYRNPYAIANEGFRENESLRTFVNFFAEYKLPGNIKYKVVVAPDLSYSHGKIFHPNIPLTHPKTNEVSLMLNVPPRGVEVINNDRLSFTNFQTLDWSKSFANLHNFNVLLGFSTEQTKTESSSVEKRGYLGNSTPELNAGTELTRMNGTSLRIKRVSYFGRINYNFNEKYLLETNFRYDGSSFFAPGNRFGFFPSVSAGWRISEESFFKNNIDFISNLKVRGSYGELGNDQIPAFSYLNKAELGRNYVFNDNVVPGIAIEDLADPLITWESVKMFNIGLNVGFFEEKLSLEIDWFDKVTDNILLQVPVPQQVGNLGAPFRNFAKVSNKGYEITINHRNNISGFSYGIGANATFIKNEIINIGEDIIFGNLNTRIHREGESIGSWYGLLSDGIFRREEEIAGAAVLGGRQTVPGDVRYIDLNNDGIINEGDRTVMGSALPRLTYALNLNAEFKSFDFSAFLQGVQGVNSWLNSNLAYPYRNGAGVTRDWLEDSWTPENVNASLPRLISPTGNLSDNNFQPSDFWLRNTSYLRLKNIQLGYTLPIKHLEKLNLLKLRLFVNAQNLFTISDFKLGDPERNNGQSNIIAYPIQKIITGGLNLTF